MSKILTREDMLAPDAVRYELVDVPGKEGKLQIRNLTSSEQSGWEASLLTDKGGANTEKLKTMKERYIAISAVDTNGNGMFHPKDIPVLCGKDTAVIDSVFDDCLKHNNVDKDTVFDGLDLGEEVKNSETI